MSRINSGISRRESLRRVGLLAAATGMPFSFAACSEQAASEQAATTWQMLTPELIDAPGYGTDPNLVHPAPASWPKTLSEAELDLVSVLSDILIPAEGELPSASAVSVPEVVDEWMSAPYPQQQGHRALLLSGLRWCDEESTRRFGQAFTEADSASQLALIEDIASANQPTEAELEGPRQFFAGFRALVAGAYYTSPAGVHELGYQGNVPVSGDYPGPTDEAMAHLNEQLNQLGLTL